MKRLLLLFVLCYSTGINAQGIELGFQVGGSNYIGDLSNNSVSLYMSETHFAIGGFASYHFGPIVAATLEFNYGTISGRDSNSSDETVRARNLSFRSYLIDAGLSAEIYIPGFQPYNLYRPISGFLFVGVGMNAYNPKTVYDGQWVNLQPLGTEGQAAYSKVTLSIPFGVGMKYAITDGFNLGLRIGARKTFSDYLDDVGGSYVSYPELLASNGELAAALGNRTGEFLNTEPVIVPTGSPRGDGTASDLTFLAMFTVSWNLSDNGLVGSRGRSKRKTGCYN
ncbi:MAG: outer membrane beta-barrel protein [Saprospiraceae bacterium]|nr:outer membrane beta-barrel protein [Saprospiraceae bacterium]